MILRTNLGVVQEKLEEVTISEQELAWQNSSLKETLAALQQQKQEAETRRIFDLLDEGMGLVTRGWCTPADFRGSCRSLPSFLPLFAKNSKLDSQIQHKNKVHLCRIKQNTVAYVLFQ